MSPTASQVQEAADLGERLSVSHQQRRYENRENEYQRVHVAMDVLKNFGAKGFENADLLQAAKAVLLKYLKVEEAKS